jgi:hypothetical protein
VTSAPTMSACKKALTRPTSPVWPGRSTQPYNILGAS